MTQCPLLALGNFSVGARLSARKTTRTFFIKARAAIAEHIERKMRSSTQLILNYFGYNTWAIC